MMYPVSEVFLSFQGEGAAIGRKAFFIRLDGCDVGCSFCDQKETWHPRYRRAATRVSASTLAAMVPRDAIAVVTGGEPALYDLEPLADALEDAGRPMHVETAGHHPVCRVDWLTVAPKAKPLNIDTQMMADEFKIVVTAPEVIAAQLARIDRRDVPIWLVPEQSQMTDRAILDAIAASVGGNVRAGWQLHMNYGVK